MSPFVTAVADVLECETIALDDEFRSVRGWCSLYGFGLLVLMENDWSAPLTLETFLRLKTVRDLYRVAFAAFVADFLKITRDEVLAAQSLGEVSTDAAMLDNLRVAAEKRFSVTYPPELRFATARIDELLI